ALTDLAEDADKPESAELADAEPEPYRSRITVRCDRCGTEATADYAVDTVARARMRRLGWYCGPAGDFCPPHAADLHTVCLTCET
ncbi:hypothetical protein, partial [Brevibacillus formosus]|uniref:hypothetical protein n=2 Tax=Bacillati TaxID=1783272 RepID=UPI003F1C8B35